MGYPGSTIRIVERGDRVLIWSPFYPLFVSRAQELGGKWDHASRSWSFDHRDGDRLREVCREVYGTAGEDVPVCTVLYHVFGRDGTGNREYTQSIYRLGRVLASRQARNARVVLGDRVVIRSGSFPVAGGSQKAPDLNPSEDMVLEVRDVPVSLLEREMGADPDYYEVLGEVPVLSEEEILASFRLWAAAHKGWIYDDLRRLIAGG